MMDAEILITEEYSMVFVVCTIYGLVEHLRLRSNEADYQLGTTGPAERVELWYKYMVDGE